MAFTVLIYRWWKDGDGCRDPFRPPQYANIPDITVHGLTREKAAELIGTIMSSELYGKVELKPEGNEDGR